jgi:hypothetical protein
VSSSGRFAWVGVLGLGVRQTGITFTLGNKIHLSGSVAGGHYATTKTNTEGSIPDFSLHNLFTLVYICLVLWWVSERLDICACIFFLFCYLAIDRRRGSISIATALCDSWLSGQHFFWLWAILSLRRFCILNDPWQLTSSSARQP